MGKTHLTKVLFIWIAAEIVVLGALLFLPAGTFRFWQAWLLLAVFFLPSLAMVARLLRRAPDLLVRRLEHEKSRVQKALMGVVYVSFVSLFLVVGFDHRYHWSQVPTALVLVANALVLLGLLVSFWGFAVNRYASSAVKVMAGQQVITAGPYALVRHPMYTGGLLMMFALPLALGSYWALVAAAPFFPLVIAGCWMKRRYCARDCPATTTTAERFAGAWCRKFGEPPKSRPPPVLLSVRARPAGATPGTARTP